MSQTPNANAVIGEQTAQERPQHETVHEVCDDHRYSRFSAGRNQHGTEHADTAITDVTLSGATSQVVESKGLSSRHEAPLSQRTAPLDSEDPSTHSAALARSQ